MPAPRCAVPVVTRRIRRPAHDVVEVITRRARPRAAWSIDLRGRGAFRAGAGPVPVVGVVPTWATRGRLSGGGMRVIPFTRVELEVSSWSSTETELLLRPVGRRAARWGRRRQDRYFSLAHLTLDRLAETGAVANRRRDVPDRGEVHLATSAA